MWNNLKKKKVIVFGILIMSIIALSVTITYAFFADIFSETQNEVVKVQTGALVLIFKDNDDIVENIEGSWNFGDTIEKELVIENTGTLDAYAKISWDGLINTYLDGSLSYTLEVKKDEKGSTWEEVETEGEKVPRSEAASTVPLADHLYIPSKHTYTYKLRITFEDLEVDQTADLNANFVTKFTIEESTEKILSTEELLAKLNIKISKNKPTNFAVPATTDETKDGLFSMEDDYGTSYYYRGTAPNNYIKFGKNKEGQEMWWRIIRFNGDGSIRIQYDGVGTVGTNTYTRGFALTNQVWNSNSHDVKYLGWMFGGLQGVASTSKEGAQKNETNSDIKTAVDVWYKDNIIETGYSNYVADVIFCNDRSTPGSTATGWTGDTGLGYGQYYTAFGPYARSGITAINYNNVHPRFTCIQENDKFTVEEASGGNGMLTYPVGLITADEIIAAGSGKFNTANSSYYLSKGNWYWSLSPGNFSLGGEGVVSTVLNESSHLNGYNVSYKGAVAPVINIKAQYLSRLKGTGIVTDPFHIVLNI